LKGLPGGWTRSCCPPGCTGPLRLPALQDGRLLLNAYIKGRQSLPEGSYDFVDVRDIARGEILAWRHGKKGETYILAGEKLSLGNMVKLVQKLVGRKIAVFRIPMWMCRLASKFIYIGYRITGKSRWSPPNPSASWRSNCVITSKKAEREIGFTHRPPADTVRDTIAWFTRAGKLLPETGGGRKRRGV
jgi:dihydroflavonol-4-reductase